MDEFNYSENYVVGFVQPCINSSNAKIEVLGYFEYSTGKFVYFDTKQRNDLFAPRGVVFAHDFMSKYATLRYKCVYLNVIPNSNTTLRDPDAYIWDKSRHVDIYATEAKEVELSFCQDSNENFKFLERLDLLDETTTIYLHSKGKIVKLEPKGERTRLLPYWNVNTITNGLFERKGKYYISTINDEPNGSIDITTNEQLIDWYTKNILKKEWSEIYTTKDFKSLDKTIKESLSSVNLPTKIFENRLTKILAINRNLQLTFDELQNLSNSQWFADIIQKSVKNNAEHYIKTIKEIYKREIDSVESENAKLLTQKYKTYNENIAELQKKYNEYKDDIDFQILELDEKINEKKEELKTAENKVEEKIKDKVLRLKQLEEQQATLVESISEKEEYIELLRNNRQHILDDFNIIKEVLGTPTNNVKAPIYNAESFSLEIIDEKDEDRLPVIMPFKKNVETYLKLYKANKISPSDIAERLASRKILLLPSDNVLKAILNATRKCVFLTEFVEVKWTSFKDLWQNGLESIVNEASLNEEIIHFLILRNIDLSYVPTYMQPLMDMENGFRTYFPNTQLTYPTNLRILCTVSGDNVIPLTENALRGIGCIGKGTELSKNEIESRFKEVAESEEAFVKGYLTASTLNSAYTEQETSTDNAYEDYVQNED